MDMGKFCYSGMLTQASNKELNEALIKMLTHKDPLESIESQTWDLQLNSNVVYPVTYISGSFNES